MKNSQIAWTDHTFNPWSGCTKVSPGCQHCYAEALSDRFNTLGKWGKGAPRVRTSENYWRQPLAWNKSVTLSEHQPCGCVVCTCEDEIRCHGCGAKHCGTHPLGRWEKPVYNRPRVFCASLADWLDEEVPIEWLADLLDLIRRTPNLDWLLLTKRPENWAKRIAALAEFREVGSPQFMWEAAWYLHRQPPANVWIGWTVEDQRRMDERTPHGLAIPAKVRFLSCEPLLEEIDFQIWGHGDADAFRESIHWVIAGGESGQNARPMDPEWARSLRDQCKAANVSFFMKQMGGVKDKLGDLEDIPEDLRIREFPTS